MSSPSSSSPFESFKKQSLPKLTRRTSIFYPTNPVEGTISFKQEEDHHHAPSVPFHRILVEISCEIKYSWQTEKTATYHTRAKTQTYPIHKETIVVAGASLSPADLASKHSSSSCNEVIPGKNYSYHFRAKIPPSALPTTDVGAAQESVAVTWSVRAVIERKRTSTTVSSDHHDDDDENEIERILGPREKFTVGSQVPRRQWLGNTIQETSHEENYSVVECGCCCEPQKISATMKLEHSVVPSTAQSVEFEVIIDKSQARSCIAGIEVSLLCTCVVPWEIMHYGKVPRSLCNAKKIFGRSLISLPIPVDVEVPVSYQGSVNFDEEGAPPTFVSPYLEVQWKVQLRIIQDEASSSSSHSEDHVFYSRDILVGQTVEDRGMEGVAEEFTKARNKKQNFPFWKEVVMSEEEKKRKEKEALLLIKEKEKEKEKAAAAAARKRKVEADEARRKSSAPPPPVAPSPSSTAGKKKIPASSLHDPTTPSSSLLDLPPPKRSSLLEAPLLLLSSSTSDDFHLPCLTRRRNKGVVDDDDDDDGSEGNMMIALSTDPMSDLQDMRRGGGGKRNNGGGGNNDDDDDDGLVPTLKDQISLSGEYEI